jgi:hypothetical protein
LLTANLYNQEGVPTANFFIPGYQTNVSFYLSFDSQTNTFGTAIIEVLNCQAYSSLDGTCQICNDRYYLSNN